MNRKKRVLTLMMLIFGLLVGTVKTLAAEINLPEGFLISDDQGMTVTKNGGYFFKLNDLFPGDTVTRKLTIKNTSSEDHTLKMYLEPISTKGPANLLENMEMRLTYDKQLIFDGNLVNQDKNVIDVGSEIDFGIIPAKTETSLSINLNVLYDVPWEHFVKDESKASVRWTFVAERAKPNTPDKPKVPGKPAKPVKPAKPIVKPVRRIPQTGERIAVWITVCGLIIIAVVWLSYYWLYKKDNEVKSTD